MKSRLVILKGSCQLQIALGMESVPQPQNRQDYCTWPACCFQTAKAVVSTVLVLVGHASLFITQI